MWWIWIIVGLTVWLGAGLLLAIILGRGIRMADVSSSGTGVLPRLDGVDAPLARPGRGPVPLPPVGIALIGAVLALETGGFVLRLTGARGPLAEAFSMDAPYSVPRLFLAGLFVVAAFVAVAGAGIQDGRRTWWLAVAGVAAGIAAVKAGSTLHADALRLLAAAVGTVGALVISASLAGAVVGALWFLSRHERRDRRRVLGALSGYAVAVVGLSALSAQAGALGSTWAAAATFVEESGEALAGVAYLVAVLVGVAPQLVLPQAWALRREEDARLAAQAVPTSSTAAS